MGYKLNYVVRGKIAGNELPLVLFHAMPLDASMWLPVCEQLAEIQPTLSTICFDAPGFGSSDAPALAAIDDPEATIANYVREIRKVLDNLGVTRVVAAGISMGGAVCAELVAQDPSRVVGLALLDTNIGADAAANAGNRERAFGLAQQGQGAQAVKDWPVSMTSPQVAASVQAWLTQQFEQLSNPGLAWASAALKNRADRRYIVGQTCGPVLLLRGKDDPTCSLEMLRELAQYRSDGTEFAGSRAHEARVVEVPDAGHFSAVEQPQRVAVELAQLWALARQ